MRESSPIWSRTHRHHPPLSRLHSSLSEDVVVIGAGICGLSVALSLLERGRRVMILEKAGIGAGQTLRTSAHLANALDDRFFDLERWHGEDGARHAAASHGRAIERIERWVERYRIDCDFRRVEGYLLREGARHEEDFDHELEAAARASLDVDRVTHVPGLLLGPALRFARQARFDPSAYLAGLAHAVVDLGGVLVEGEATAIEGGASPRVHTATRQTVAARVVVAATNVPFHECIAIHTKQAAYRTYVVGCPIPRTAFPDILLWDMADPYHYVRRVDDADSEASWLLVGGGDHKTGQDDAGTGYGELVEWTRARFPFVGPVEWTWSGQVVEPVDGLAFIGRDPGGMENVYVATGDSGNGLTHGTVAAEVIPALIAGEADPYEGLYDPRRKPLRAMAGWISENANVARQYADWLAPGDAHPLARTEGTVVRQGIHRVAVSRDENGVLHAFSAVCPHLGCAVRWNAAERTWDCPCHGSRFDPVAGRVLNGPASRGLDPLEIAENDS